MPENLLIPSSPRDGDVFLFKVNNHTEKLYERKNGKWVNIIAK